VAIPSAAAEPAQLTLELSPAERAAEVVSVRALDREVPQKMTGRTVAIREVNGRRGPGAVGAWVIDGLKPGRYDLYVETKRGKFEGYALRPEETSDAGLSERDRTRIAEIFGKLKTFEDRKRILALGGNGRQAVALVELLRTSKTTFERKAPNSCIWRVEYWQFDKLYGAWTKGDYKVLRRFMAPKSEFSGWNWSFVAELGGLELKPGEKRSLRWTIPEKFDPARGLAAAGVRGPPEPAR
jgi:hypothetical protein